MVIPSKKYDVSVALRFVVELDGLIVGGFSDVTGLSSETEIMEYPEGGLNTHVHQLLKRNKYPRIQLKRGITNSSELWDWYSGVASGKIKRKSGTVILYNHAGKEICRWNFFEAFPVKWTGPDMSATSTSVAIETIEIVHNGLKTIFSKK